jgi:hypothetical protein
MKKEEPPKVPLSHFHNQKEPDFNPETGMVNSPWSDEQKKHNQFQDSKRFSEEVGNTSALEKQIEDVIELIDNIELDPKFRNDKTQIELLKKTKDGAKIKIREILSYLENYMVAVNQLDTVKTEKKNYDEEKYQIIFKKAEDDRELRHKILFSALLSTIKFISHSFGEISEEAIEKWEDEREEKNLPILHVKRVKFPDKVLCPDNVNLKDRKGIYPWAVQLSYSLGKLKNGLT